MLTSRANFIVNVWLNIVFTFLDIRIKISLSNPTEGQIKEVKGFCERFKISHCEDAVKLRQHFNDFLDEVINE